MKLIDDLTKAQQLEGLNDEDFGAKLGLSRGHWNRIKHGRHGQFSETLLRNIRKAYPGLKNEIDIFLSSDITNQNMETAKEEAR